MQLYQSTTSGLPYKPSLLQWGVSFLFVFAAQPHVHPRTCMHMHKSHAYIGMHRQGHAKMPYTSQCITVTKTTVNKCVLAPAAKRPNLNLHDALRYGVVYFCGRDYGLRPFVKPALHLHSASADISNLEDKKDGRVSDGLVHFDMDFGKAHNCLQSESHSRWVVQGLSVWTIHFQRMYCRSSTWYARILLADSLR